VTDSWSELEERDFAKVMEAGKLERMPAIRLYRRCRGNLDRALVIATANAPSETEIARHRAVGNAARMRHAQRREEAESQAAD
jgi:hypothetical protein